jgi:hypothetical protein
MKDTKSGAVISLQLWYAIGIAETLDTITRDGASHHYPLDSKRLRN